MKALLIIHDLYQEDNYYPLGPAYLASIMRNNGVDVTVACQDIYHYSNEELVRKFIKGKSYDIIGLGFLSARFTETVLPLCKEINKHKGDAKLVLGGHGSSALPEYTQKATDANIIAVGELENGIMDLFDMEDCIFYCPPVKKLDTIPFPAWDLFPMDKYSTCTKDPGQDKNEKMLLVATSRGCINNPRCSFCAPLVPGIRLRSVKNVVEELKILHDKYGISFFEFADECFVFNKKRILEFKSELKSQGLDIGYWCAARVEHITGELLQLMKETGCRFINYGFESMDAQVLKTMNKNTTPEMNEMAAKLTKDADIPFGINMIWNNIGDTKESLDKSVKFIKRHNSYDQTRSIRPCTPYPCCELYNYAINNNLLSGPQDFFNKFKNSDLITVNFMEMSDEDAYKCLFKVNKELILDHYQHTDMPIDEANYMIEQFRILYFDKEVDKRKFRGARHYDKKGD